MPSWIPQETAMRLWIQLLHRGEAVKERLRRDGWKLEAESIDTLSAYHATVDSELAARRRLHGLGLLTSATLRIEFRLLDLSGCVGTTARAEGRYLISTTRTSESGRE